MPDDTAEQLEERFASLAEEVETILRRIREREAQAEAKRKGVPYVPVPAYNIFKELPGKPGGGGACPLRAFPGFANEFLEMTLESEDNSTHTPSSATKCPCEVQPYLPTGSGFEYIKVPKKPAELCFGSKTERIVFPDIPGILKNKHLSLNNVKTLTSWKPGRRRSSKKKDDH